MAKKESEQEPRKERAEKDVVSPGNPGQGDNALNLVSLSRGDRTPVILKLDYRAANFDKELCSANYTQINITNVPDGVHVRQDMDQSGHYFFYFTDGKSYSKPHFYLDQAKTLTTNNENRAINLDDARMNVNSMHKVNFYPVVDGSLNGQSLPHPQTDADGNITSYGNPVLDFANRMSGYSDKFLDIERQRLEAQAKNSKDPFDHVKLAAIYTYQAFGPVLRQIKANYAANPDQPVELNLQKSTMMPALDKAEAELRKADQLSAAEGRLNGHSAIAHPGYMFDGTRFEDPFNPYYYMFVYDQSAFLSQGLKGMRTLIQMIPDGNYQITP